jgi:4-aminobutyrate aminotransferase
VLRIAPPLSLTVAEAEEGADVLEAALAAARQDYAARVAL